MSASSSSADSDGDARALAGHRARSFFDGLWSQGDYWQLETSEFEQAKYDRALRLIDDRRYSRALDIGCGAGAFTRLLAGTSDRVVGLDVSSAAIDRARQRHGDLDAVEFRLANVMEAALKKEGPWDLVVMNETIYYLGWLYSFFNISRLARRLLAATADGGRFLMVNTFGDAVGHLLRPWLIYTYRDLFLNVGFRLEREEVFRGTKDGIPLDVLMSLFERPPAVVGRDSGVA